MTQKAIKLLDKVYRLAEIGKEDLSNPKYATYFKEIQEALSAFNPPAPAQGVEEVLVMFDWIDDEFVEIQTIEQGIRYVRENYVDGDSMHPDFDSFDVYKKVGDVHVSEDKDGNATGIFSRWQQERGGEYQDRVNDWMQVCFGKEIASDITERNHRFFEEATELVQATGMTKSECLQLVDYVFNREVGVIEQEIGGVMVTLAALCNAAHKNMNNAGVKELERIWTKIEKIREKQANKPKLSPLPEHIPPGTSPYDGVSMPLPTATEGKGVIVIDGIAFTPDEIKRLVISTRDTAETLESLVDKFKQLIKAAKEQHTPSLQQPTPTIGARWVKASERLPENLRPVKVRIDEKEEHESKWDESEKAFMIGGKRFPPRLYFIQWRYLDESPASFPTREQAQKWVDELGVPAWAWASASRAALAMYDWIKQMLEKKDPPQE